MTFTKSPIVTPGWITLASCFLVALGHRFDWIELWLSRDMETLRDTLALTKQTPSHQGVMERAAKARDAS